MGQEHDTYELNGEISAHTHTYKNIMHTQSVYVYFR
jgi:hypothetical protein